MGIRLRILLLTMLVTGQGGAVSAQRSESAGACSEPAFAAVRELPKLEYECPANSNEYDNAVLRAAVRRAAVARAIKVLQSFTAAAWWRAKVDDLHACAIHKQPGPLTDDENEAWHGGDYYFDLFGNDYMRIVLVRDACYQTAFGGANAFLLVRQDGKVTVSQLLDGYYSRVENAVSVTFATIAGEQLIELSTANTMPPTLTNYYFTVNRVTKRAVPAKIFREGGRLTHEIRSAMLLGEPQQFGLPPDASQLQVVRDGRLAPTFSVYEDNERGRIQNDGRKLRRIIYRWNGRFYAPVRRAPPVAR